MKQMELLRDVGDDFERALFAAVEREPIPLSSKQDVARCLGLALPSARPAADVSTTPRLGRSVWGKLTFLAAIGGLGFIWGGSLLGAARSADDTGAKPSAVVAASSRATLASTTLTPEIERSEPENSDAESTTHEAHQGAATTVAADERSPRSSRPRRERHSASASATQHTAASNRVTPPSASLAGASDTNDGGLLREVRSLDAVRTALRAHDGTRALERLDGYSSEFPHGELAIESQVLRVAALAQTKQRAAARALALRTLGIPGSARYRTELERSLHALERPTATE